MTYTINISIFLPQLELHEAKNRDTNFYPGENLGSLSHCCTVEILVGKSFFSDCSTWIKELYGFHSQIWTAKIQKATRWH